MAGGASERGQAAGALGWVVGPGAVGKLVGVRATEMVAEMAAVAAGTAGTAAAVRASGTAQRSRCCTHRDLRGLEDTHRRLGDQLDTHMQKGKLRCPRGLSRAMRLPSALVLVAEFITVKFTAMSGNRPVAALRSILLGMRVALGETIGVVGFRLKVPMNGSVTAVPPSRSFR